MAGFFAFLFLGSIVGFLVSMAKPSLFSKILVSTRKTGSMFFGGLAVFFFILTGVNAPEASVKGVSATITPTVEATITANPTSLPSITPTQEPTSSPIPTKYVAPTTVPTKKITYPTATPYVPATMVPVTIEQPTQTQTSGGYSCNCSKTCTQISSCAEAQYQLNACGCSVRDGDKDGIACDSAPLHCQN